MIFSFLQDWLSGEGDMWNDILEMIRENLNNSWLVTCTIVVDNGFKCWFNSFLIISKSLMTRTHFSLWSCFGVLRAIQCRTSIFSRKINIQTVKLAALLLCCYCRHFNCFGDFFYLHEHTFLQSLTLLQQQSPLEHTQCKPYIQTMELLINWKTSKA